MGWCEQGMGWGHGNLHTLMGGRCPDVHSPRWVQPKCRGVPDLCGWRCMSSVGRLGKLRALQVCPALYGGDGNVDD